MKHMVSFVYFLLEAPVGNIDIYFFSIEYLFVYIMNKSFKS